MIVDVHHMSLGGGSPGEGTVGEMRSEIGIVGLKRGEIVDEAAPAWVASKTSPEIGSAVLRDIFPSV